jgi:hypothetical protein
MPSVLILPSGNADVRHRAPSDVGRCSTLVIGTGARIAGQPMRAEARHTGRGRRLGPAHESAKTPKGTNVGGSLLQTFDVSGGECCGVDS